MNSCEGSETLVRLLRFHRRFPKCLIMLLCITSISGESAYISDFYSFRHLRLMFYGYLHVGVIGILLHIFSELCHILQCITR